MANPELLTLAKVLSVKNRLAGRLAQARSNIETCNSVLAGQRDDYGKATVDVRAEYDRYRKLQDGLIVVKAAIQRANLPIHEDILQLGELKSVIQMLSGLDTKNGTEPGYNGVEFRFSAVILKPEALGIIRELEVQIDAIQDKINTNRLPCSPFPTDLPQAPGFRAPQCGTFFDRRRRFACSGWHRRQSWRTTGTSSCAGMPRPSYGIPSRE